MKIQLIVHHELDHNAGASGGMYQVCRHYRELGHTAGIYSWSNLPSRFSPRRKQLLFPLFVACHLARAVRRDRLDVVDASTSDTWVWALLDPARRRTVLVTTSHGLEHVAAEARRESARDGLLHLSWKYPLYYAGLHLREVELTLRRADLVFLLNHYDQRHAVEDLGVDVNRIRIVSNGIRDDFVDLPTEPTPMEPSSGIRIAQIASYLPQKGVGYGALALSAALRGHPEVSVSLLGTGVDDDVVLGDFAPELHERITVVKRYENLDLPAHLHGHQVVLFPTLSEGFGTGLLEAMACGLAPVSTATPGPSEYVRDNENGLLVEPRSSDALAAALDRLIDDRNLLDRLRQAAHATAQPFTWRETSLRRLAYYQDAIAAKQQVVATEAVSGR